MPKRLKFSQEDEQKIINFVKSNDILYNKKHKKFRDSEAKKRLWLQLAKELKVDVDIVKKKWIVMRDYFVHSRVKKATGSAASASISKREDALSFLLQTSTVKRRSISSLAPTNEQTESSNMTNEAATDDDFLNGASRFKSTEPVFEEVFCPSSVSDTSSAKRRTTSHQTESNDILREFLSQLSKPSDFIPGKIDDGVQQFFDSMASTVRSLSQSAIARIKMKVAQIVGEEELAWAEENAARNANCPYLQ